MSDQPLASDPPILDYASSNVAKRKRTLVVGAVIVVFAIPLFVLFAVPDMVGCICSTRVELARSAIDSQNGPIATALNLYRLNTRHFPVSLANLASRPANEQGWSGPYIGEAAKLLDPWGRPYQYRCPGTSGREYDLWSTGPDKVNDTQDDITN